MIAVAPALLLLVATIAVWFVAAGARAAVRLQIRFAGVLFAALAVAALATFAAAVTLLVLPIALAVLMLATAAGFARPPPPALAAVTLAAVSLTGLAASITGLAAFSLAPSAIATIAIAVLCLRRFGGAGANAIQGLLGALCFLAATSSFTLDGVGAAPLLFSAAGLLGLTLALSRSDSVVEQRRGDLRDTPAIGGGREA